MWGLPPCRARAGQVNAGTQARALFEKFNVILDESGTTWSMCVRVTPVQLVQPTPRQKLPPHPLQQECARGWPPEWLGARMDSLQERKRFLFSVL